MFPHGSLLILIIFPNIHFTEERFQSTNSLNPVFYKEATCLDLPTSYSCVCPADFRWNSKVCVANSLYTHFEFSAKRASLFHYSLLTNQLIPSLTNFTVSFWVQTANPNYPGIVLSHYDRISNKTYMTLKSGPTLSMRLMGHYISTSIKLPAFVWTHVVWTWISDEGSTEWNLYTDASLSASGRITEENQTKATDGGGVMVLGQSASLLLNIESVVIPSSLDCCTFEGNISFVNIWDYSLDKNEIVSLKKDCKLEKTGNAVQWGNFKSGAKSVKTRWPTTVYGTFDDPIKDIFIQ